MNLTISSVSLSFGGLDEDSKYCSHSFDTLTTELSEYTEQVYFISFKFINKALARR